MNRTKTTASFAAVAVASAISMAVSSCGSDDGGFQAADVSLQTPAAYVATARIPSASLSEYDLHLQVATDNAGTDNFFKTELRRQWCYSVENPGSPPELQNHAVLPVTKIFDDVYVDGYRWVAQFSFKTDTGLIFLDGLNAPSDATALTLPALASEGYTPQQVKAIIPTHGHGDHTGIVAYMYQNYGTPTYLGSADFTLARGSANVGTTPMNALDSSVLTPQTLTIDGKVLTMLSTPGHTAGTFSGVWPVHVGGVAYKMAFWGGTGTPTTAALAAQYLDGAQRLWELSRVQEADGTMHTHVFVDGTLQKIDAIAANPSIAGSAATNPFIMGTAKVLRSYSMLRECAAAKVAALTPTATNPVWRYTTTEVYGARSGFTGPGQFTVSVGARVADAYAVQPNVTVRFQLTGRSEGCTAMTDANGNASCRFGTLAEVPAGTTVRATFDGATTPTVVELASFGTAPLTRS